MVLRVVPGDRVQSVGSTMVAGVLDIPVCVWEGVLLLKGVGVGSLYTSP